MKLDSLRLRNINSLKGEHFIDFSAPPLADCAMFLITGPTGSGKTTILDAVTAALYDRTPRLNSKTTRALKSQTAESAMIELCYTVRGERYKNVWQVDKKDNKKISVYRNGELVSGLKISALAEKTFEIIGADFDTFVKTIVLAQNKFDEFIKSRPDERRRIIESITDNTVLEEIKKRIKDEYDAFGQQYGAMKQKVETLKELAAAADPEALKRLLAEKLSLLETEKKAAAAAAKNKNEAETLKTLHAEFTAANDELVKIDAGFNFAAMLAEIAALRTVRDKFGAVIPEIKNAAGRLESKNAAAEEEKARLDRLEKEITAAGEAYAAAKKERGDFDAAYSKKTAEISAARSLAGPFAEAARSHSAVLKKAAELKKSLTEAEAAAEKIRKSIKAAETEKKTLEDGRALFGPEYENSEEAFYEFRSNIERIKALKAELEKSGAEIEKNQSAMKAEGARIEELRNKTLKNSAEAAMLTAEKASAEKSKASLEAEYELCGAGETAAALRERLVSGEKCPVCGSLEHPDAGKEFPRARDSKKIKAEIKTYENKIKTCEAGLRALEASDAADRATIDALAAALDSKTAGDIILKEAFDRAAGELNSLKLSLAAPFTLEDDKYDEAAERWAGAIKFLAGHKENMAAVEKKLALSVNDMTNAAANIGRLKESLEDAAAEAGALKKHKDALEMEIKNITGGETPESILAGLEAAKSSLEKRFEAAESAFNSLNSAIAAKKHLIENIGTEIAALKESSLAARAAFEAALRESAMDEMTALQRHGRLIELSAMEACYNEKMTAKSVAEARAAGLAEKIGGRVFSESALAATAEEERRRSEAVELLNREAGGIAAELKKHAEALAGYEAEKAKFEKNNAEHETLEQLYLRTKDNQFRDFVLAFYLKNLLLLSNQYLKTLTGGRYELMFDLDSSNAIFIRDYFNEGREREINTVSGGEGFMASLSLALGLSQVSSGEGRIEFMFLDEGFGVLDSGTLEDVLDMVSRLNDTGRKIGIISHIQQVKDRIDTRIELIKNNDGSSNIKIY